MKSAEAVDGAAGRVPSRCLPAMHGADASHGRKPACAAGRGPATGKRVVRADGPDSGTRRCDAIFLQRACEDG